MTEKYNNEVDPFKDKSDQSTEKQLKLDVIDWKILKLLSQNSLLTREEIADQIGVSSPTTISNRVKKLIETNIITGYCAKINFDLLGLSEWKVVIEVQVSKGELISTEQEIAKLPDCLAVYDSTGTTDIIVIARFKRREDLSNFTKKLLSMEFVERTISHVVLSTVKEDFNKLN
ncbi:MAG: Lrp/AsnC family transcriptional regulator [Candidatus Hodarchaeales archaeon]|jgi:DNA-binding Lrp family transcriptional regulator